ncbi:MAG TPA: ABC transporter permease [Pyrinomonadaceae bacterium]|nr:ABC transporter permease [Pyrinomonadaceae bacterium]
MNAIWQDLRYGVRLLLKNPVVTAAAVITLALGIGANTAIFSVVNAVMLRPLPYRNPDRVVSLWENVPTHGQWRVTPANFLDWKQQNTVFENVAAFGAATMTLTGDGEPEQLLGTRASNGYFEVVGVQPMLGRSFVEEEYKPGKGQVVILAESFWQRRFGGDPNVINKDLTLNGASYNVVGVMPSSIYPVWPTTAGRISFNENEQQFWTPMSFTAEWAAVRTAHVLGVVARLKPDVTLEQAKAEMNTIGARLERDHAANKGEGIIVNSFMDEIVGTIRPALIILLGAVLLVLLIACANIAGLLLAQHAARSKEIAIRAALGAGRARLVRQFFLEGFLLSLLGTTAGIMLAQLGIGSILKLMPADIPRLNQVHIDYRVLGFSLLLALFTTLIFGLVPAWNASKSDLHSTLEQGGRSSGPNSGRQKFRHSLVVLQVALAVLLVVGAGLLLKSFWRLSQVDPGFRKENLLSLNITLPRSGYADGPRINNFYNQLLERISNLPGVDAAAIAYDQPLQSNWIDSFRVEGRAQDQASGAASASFIPASWDYFRTVGTGIVSGRSFTPQDDADHPGVVIVNEAFVRHYFPNEQALGQRLRLSAPARIWDNQRLISFEIVGIARDVKSAGLQAAADPAYYVPSTQAPLQDMTVLVRTKNDPTSLVPSLRSSVWAIDPKQPVSNITTMEKLVDESIAQPRLNMMLMGLFGILALLLAAVGIYGLLSYAVTQRTQEIGIRMALGAQVTDVLTMILKQGMTLSFVGIGLGLLGAFALTRLMRGLLFGVGPTDATTFILVSGVLIAVGLVACYLPARRAARVDPLVALRYE